MKTGIASIPALLAIFLAGTLLAGPSRLSVDLGVQIFQGEKARPAARSNRARLGERIAVYLRPRQSISFYIIESNDRQARLVHRGKSRKARQEVLPPGKLGLKKGDWEYQFIASGAPIPRLEQMFRKGNVDGKVWNRYAAQLKERGRIRLGSSSEKPPALAANVRSAKPGSAAGSDPYFQRLRTFSGNGLVIQSFTFSVR